MTHARDIKQEKRKAFFLREISQLIYELAKDEPALLDVVITKIDFSPGDGMCYVFFSSHLGKEAYMKALDLLKLYKPSLRTALSKIREARYVPDIRFFYDESMEKSRRIDELLDQAKKEIK